MEAIWKLHEEFGCKVAMVGDTEQIQRWRGRRTRRRRARDDAEHRAREERNGNTSRGARRHTHLARLGSIYDNELLKYSREDHCLTPIDW
jgi:hypothetical protein